VGPAVKSPLATSATTTPSVPLRAQLKPAGGPIENTFIFFIVAVPFVYQRPLVDEPKIIAEPRSAGSVDTIVAASTQVFTTIRSTLHRRAAIHINGVNINEVELQGVELNGVQPSSIQPSGRETSTAYGDAGVGSTILIFVPRTAPSRAR